MNNPQHLDRAWRSKPIQNQMPRLSDSPSPVHEAISVLKVDCPQMRDPSDRMREGWSRAPNQVLAHSHKEALVAHGSRKAVLFGALEQHFIKTRLAGPGEPPPQP